MAVANFLSNSRSRSSGLNWSSGSSGGGRSSSSRSRSSRRVTVHLCLRAITGDVASFTATVAGLACRIKACWTSIRSGAVAGNMTKLAAGIALHGLGLAIASEVIRTTALVASSCASSASEASSEASVSTTRGTCSTAHSRVRAVAGKVTGETT